MKKNVLVFPCGSEIALEVYRSLKNSIHFNIIGASSVDDHGKFVFENYIGGLPFVNSSEFIEKIKKIVIDYKIDIIYPAMDSVITVLKNAEKELNCTVISSPAETTEICLSKEKTYLKLHDCIKTPKMYCSDNVERYPVFCKPKIGYGSRGTKKILNKKSLEEHLIEFPDSLILEYLPGNEYTIDCFTDKNRNLLVCEARIRNRISNGISVNTKPVSDNSEFKIIAEKINKKIVFRGAWFIQLKRNQKNELVLLEIASRLGGSSSLLRAKNINFAQLSLFDAMGYDVSIIENPIQPEMDRALDNKFELNFDFKTVYIDWDDTIILNKTFYNVEAISFLYKCINKNIKIILLSHHEGDLIKDVKNFNLFHLFSEIIQIPLNVKKSEKIKDNSAIFIDDSFSERNDVAINCKIPVFGIDMINNIL